MFQRIQSAPATILAVRAVGKITDEDYKTMLIPAVEYRIKTDGKVRLLYEIGHEFEGFDPQAALDDAQLGLTHWEDFERVAIVTDREWIANAMRLFMPFQPAKMKLFSVEHLEEAMTWAAD